MVKRMPPSMDFAYACEHRPILQFFRGCRESMDDIEELFKETLRQTPVKVLPKKEDPGQFLIPCSINGTQLTDSFCDTGASVNVMAGTTAEHLGITNIDPPTVKLKFANGSADTDHGIALDVPIRIGDVIIPTDFHILKPTAGETIPVILGRPFLASTGAVIDMNTELLCLKLVDEERFYSPLPPNSYNSNTPVSGSAGRKGGTPHTATNSGVRRSEIDPGPMNFKKIETRFTAGFKPSDA